VLGWDEAKLLGERGNVVWRLGSKERCVVVEAVKVKAGPVLWRGDDVLLERVVAELGVS
jgi:hypothetical protein